VKCSKEDIEIRLIGCKEDSIIFPDQQETLVSVIKPISKKISITLKHKTWNDEKSLDLEIKEERKLRIYLDKDVMKNLLKLLIEKRLFLDTQIIVTKNIKNADLILIPSINRNKIHWDEIGENVFNLKKTSNAQIFILKGMKIEDRNDPSYIESLFLQR
jgi:Holliday junction resolvase